MPPTLEFPRVILIVQRQGRAGGGRLVFSLWAARCGFVASVKAMVALCSSASSRTASWCTSEWVWHDAAHGQAAGMSVAKNALTSDSSLSGIPCRRLVVERVICLTHLSLACFVHAMLACLLHRQGSADVIPLAPRAVDVDLQGVGEGARYPVPHPPPLPAILPAGLLPSPAVPLCVSWGESGRASWAYQRSSSSRDW